MASSEDPSRHQKETKRHGASWHHTTEKTHTLVGDESSRTATIHRSDINLSGANAAPRMRFAHSENHLAFELHCEMLLLSEEQK